MKRTKFRRTKPPHSAEPSYPSVAPVGQAEMSRFSTARQIDESKLPQEYKFYKLNQTSKAYKLPLEELKKKYLAFLKTKELSLIHI